LLDAGSELRRADLLLLLDLVGIDDDRRDALRLLEFALVEGRCVLRLEGADAYAVPQAAPGDVGCLTERLMSSAAQLFDEAVRVLLSREARHLHEEATLHAGFGQGR